MIPVALPLIGLAACVALMFAIAASRYLKRARPAFLVAAIGLMFYAGAKHQYGTVTYAYTDVETRYLFDAGSYVTNDAVYVSFTRVLAPDSAEFIIEAIEIGNTNREDFVTVYEGTFGTFENPSFVPFPAASNYNFYAYTTWTPGPAVKTNGVVDINWRMDNQGNGTIVPIRTGVYLGGEKVSPPTVVIDADLSGPLLGNQSGEPGENVGGAENE